MGTGESPEAFLSRRVHVHRRRQLKLLGMGAIRFHTHRLLGRSDRGMLQRRVREHDIMEDEERQLQQGTACHRGLIDQLSLHDGVVRDACSLG